jgi:glycosyltransferase involved in cell wall biosynthesis
MAFPDSKPLITTIIPTYRRPRLLQRAIKSVLAQTYPHFQVCVYDNASGDETATVVRTLAKADPRAKYYCHPENIGGFKNLVYGMARVETPFFSLLADDDVLLPEMYQVLLAGMEKFPEAMISAAPTIQVDDQDRVLWVPLSNWRAGLHTPPEGMLAMLQDGHPPIWTGMLFRREVLKEVGYLDEKVGNPSDLDFQLRIAARFPIVVSLQPVAILVVHPACQMLSGTFEEKYGGWLELIGKVTGDEVIPYPTRRQAVDLLDGRLKTWLSQAAASSIVRGEWGKADKAIDILQNHYHLTLRSSLLRILTRTCRSVPPIHVLLKGARFLKRFVFSLLPDPTKYLQSQYGAYLRYLKL